MNWKKIIVPGLFLIFCSCFPCCYHPTYIYSPGYTKIKNNTNDLIGVYFNDIFLDTLKQQQSAKYIYMISVRTHVLFIKSVHAMIHTDIIIHSKKDREQDNIPLYYKGIVNDSIKYRYDLQPLQINKPTPDSIIIFEDMENK